MSEYDYIIIGGGLAGLYVAYKLNQMEPNAKLLILERNRAMGGRIDTIGKTRGGRGTFPRRKQITIGIDKRTRFK